MAMTQIDYPTVGAASWTDDIDISKDWIIGHIGLGLTNFENDSIPEVAQGSKVEIGGSYFIAGTDQAITGSPTNDSINYVYIDTSGVLSWSDTAPARDDTKQGWYNGTSRAVAGSYFLTSGSVYSGKFVYVAGIRKYFNHKPTLDQYINSRGRIDTIFEQGGNDLKVKIIEIGTWNMNTTSFVDVTHGLTVANIRSVDVTILDDSGGMTKLYALTGSGHTDSTLQGGISTLGGTDMRLHRLTGGLFDAASWSAGSQRGWITVWYV